MNEFEKEIDRLIKEEEKYRPIAKFVKEEKKKLSIGITAITAGAALTAIYYSILVLKEIYHAYLFFSK